MVWKCGKEWAERCLLLLGRGANLVGEEKAGVAALKLTLLRVLPWT